MKRLLYLSLLSLFFLSACFNNEVDKDADDTENNDQEHIEDDMLDDEENHADTSNEQQQDRDAGSEDPVDSDSDQEQDISEGDVDSEQDQKAELTPEDAEILVRKQLGIEHNTEIHVRFDHEDNGRYLIQVYESVGEGETAHTATLGWYYVDKVTGEIEDLFE